MLIKRIEPKELPANLIFRLNYLYHTKLDEFVVAVDTKKEIMYVNPSVPEKDVEGFMECVTFPYYWMADNEEGKGYFLDYVYDKYGFGTCHILSDSHKWHMDKKERCRAGKAAQAIIPLIEKEINSETLAAEYDEYLSSEIWNHGLRTGKHTPKNISSYGSMYIFYFGYLMGAGMIKDGAVWQD